MTDTALHPALGQQNRAETVRYAAPVPFDAPVLITDCATPLAGETLLSLLWRRLDRTDADQP